MNIRAKFAVPTHGEHDGLAQQNGWRMPQENVIENFGTYGETWFGKRFAKRFINCVIYVPQTQSWLQWTGSGWAVMCNPELDALCIGVAEAELKAAHERYRADPNDYYKRLKWKAERFYELLAKVRNIAEAGGQCHRPMGEFSQLRPQSLVSRLGVRNGVVDLTNGNLLDARPDQRISKLAGVAFDANASCPKWLKFLETVQPETEMRELLQRAAGYTLTGLVDEEKWFFTYGEGANGKSVFINVLAALLGDCAVTLGNALVTKNKHENEAERMKARLPGKRLVLVNEVALGDIWDDQRMKEITSREKISARFLHKEAFEFMPTHALWVRGNHLPGVMDAGHGFWRRIIPILFGRSFEPHEMISDLDRQIISEELPGVLNWAIEGALKWKEGGLAVPASVNTMASEYREDTDLIGQWFAERCELDPEARTSIAEAFDSFRGFCAEQGVAHGSKMMLSRALKARGFRSAPGRKKGRKIMGFRVLPPFENLDDPDGLE